MRQFRRILCVLLAVFLLASFSTAFLATARETALSPVTAYATGCTTGDSYLYGGKEYGVPALFDNDASTKWFSEAASTIHSTYPVCLYMQYGEAMPIAGYWMTTAEDNVKTGRSPVEWKLFGSQTGDSGSWTELHHVENGGFTADYQEKYFQLDAAASYPWYKIEFYSIVGGSSQGRGVQLSALRFDVTEDTLTNYRWNWGGSARPDTLEAEVGDNTLTKTAGNYYTAEKTIHLSGTRDWTIEWKGFNTTNAVLLSASGGAKAAGDPYYFYPLAKDNDTTGYFVELRHGENTKRITVVSFTNLDETLVKDNGVVWSFSHAPGGVYTLTAVKNGQVAYTSTKTVADGDGDVRFGCVLGYYTDSIILPYSTYLEYLHIYEGKQTEPVDYRWNWGGSARPDTLEAEVGDNTLTKTAGNYYTAEKTIHLSGTKDWTIEWKGFNTTNAVLLSASGGAKAAGDPYYFYPLAKDNDTTGYFVELRHEENTKRITVVSFTNLDETLVKDNGVVWSFSHAPGGVYTLTAAKNGQVAYTSTKTVADGDGDVRFGCVLGYYTDSIILPYSTYLEYLHIYEKAQADDLISEEPLTLEYGDYAAVSNAGTETTVVDGSDKVEIVQLDGKNHVHALAVGEATIRAGEVERTITVTKARLNLVLVAGQSNANGIHGGRGEVHAPELGDGFWWDGGLRDLKLHTRTITGTSVGWYPALAAEWHALTGEKTVILRRCIPGTPISAWADYTTGAVTSYTTGVAADVAACIQALQSDPNVELVRTGYYWLQGETDAFLTNSEGITDYTTAAKYETAYLGMHNAYLNALRVDGLPAPYGAIFSCRTRNQIAAYGAIESCGVRVAQQHLANTQENLYMASVIADGWTADPIRFTSASGVQIQTNGAAAGANNIHYNQVGYNILGMDAADHMYQALCAEEPPVVTDFEVIGHDGRTKYEAGDAIFVEHNLRFIGVNNGEEDTDRAQLVVRPLPISADDAAVTFSVTDRNGREKTGVIDRFGMIDAAKVTEELTLTIRVGTVEKQFLLTCEDASTQLIPFDDENIKYVGRWSMEADHAEGYWSGTYFEAGFTGGTCKLLLAENAQIYVAADGREAVQISNANGKVDLSAYLNPALDTHTVRIGVANDTGSHLEVEGLVIGAHDTLTPPTKKLLVEFIGDSITAGAYLNPQSANTYAYMTGQRLAVDHTPVAIGGISLIDGNNGNRGSGICTPETPAMNQRYFWFKPLDKDAPNGKWDFRANQAPDLIVINLGTNDRNANAATDAFRDAYISFIRSIRVQRGKQTPIVAMIPLQGFMAEAITAACDALNDPNLYLVDGTDWITRSDLLDSAHPNQAGHQKVADQLSAAIRKVLLDAAVEEALAVTDGVLVLDGKTAEEVELGIRFVTTEEQKALTDAAEAVRASAETALTLKEVFASMDHLKQAAAAYTAQIKTGSQSTTVTVSLLGETEADVETETLTYTVHAADLKDAATATITFEVAGADLTKAVVEGQNGFSVFAQFAGNGKLTVIFGSYTGYTGDGDLLTLTLPTTGEPGQVTVTMTTVELSVFAGAGEAYIPVRLEPASVTTRLDYSRYDVNCDGAVNQLDLTRIQRHYGTTPDQDNWNPRADVTGDGKIEIDDIILVINQYYIF